MSVQSENSGTSHTISLQDGGGGGGESCFGSEISIAIKCIARSMVSLIRGLL